MTENGQNLNLKFLSLGLIATMYRFLGLASGLRIPQG
jgi:hypothetical protein